MPFEPGMPLAGEFPTGVQKYVDLVPAGGLMTLLAGQLDSLQKLLTPLDEAEALRPHPPYTWSIKQVVGHLADSERVFGYRAMRVARKDATPLPGFDENAYVLTADFNRVPLGDLLEELTLARRSQLKMLQALPEEAWLHTGQVNQHATTTRGVVHTMAGHMQHHLNVLKLRLE